MKLLLKTLILVFAAAVGSPLFSQAPAAAPEDLNRAFREFAELHAEIVLAVQREYGAEVRGQDLVYASIQGLLRNLDPHTAFLSPKAYGAMKSRQAATYFGIGALVGKRDNRITIIAPLDDTPAFRAGLRTGDVISRIDGAETAGMTVAEAVGRIKGPEGSEVELTILRVGRDGEFPVRLKRAEIPQETVRFSYLMPPDVGYLRVLEFSRSTAGEVREALDRLRRQGMKKLLLDLRSNIGGLLVPAVEVADNFVPEGALIVEVRARIDELRKSYRGSENSVDWTLPLVVLVNGGTTSAGEILSGAIQDNDLGLLVGTRTWGKGLVQTVYNLSHGAGIALSTARYHTPSGRQIQRDYTSYYDYYRHSIPPGEASLARGEQGAGKPQEVFQTGLGRRVLGGGGIRPDFVVELPEPSPFLQLLYSRNAFLDFATSSLARSGYDPSSASDQELFDDFSSWLVREEKIAEEEVARALTDPVDRGRAINQIRSDIALAESGSEAAHRILALQDPQIQRALELFGEAAELLGRRQ